MDCRKTPHMEVVVTQHCWHKNEAVQQGTDMLVRAMHCCYCESVGLQTATRERIKSHGPHTSQLRWAEVVPTLGQRECVSAEEKETMGGPKAPVPATQKPAPFAPSPDTQ